MAGRANALMDRKVDENLGVSLSLSKGADEWPDDGWPTKNSHTLVRPTVIGKIKWLKPWQLIVFNGSSWLSTKGHYSNVF